MVMLVPNAGEIRNAAGDVGDGIMKVWRDCANAQNTNSKV